MVAGSDETSWLAKNWPRKKHFIGVAEFFDGFLSTACLSNIGMEEEVGTASVVLSKVALGTLRSQELEVLSLLFEA